jgi:hypothetical protein
VGASPRPPRVLGVATTAAPILWVGLGLSLSAYPAAAQSNRGSTQRESIKGGDSTDLLNRPGGNNGAGTPPGSGAGAPVTGKRFEQAGAPFTDQDINTWINEGKTQFPNAKFVYIPAGTPAPMLPVMRVGLHKAWNQLCMGPTEVQIGADVSKGRGLVFALDPSKCFDKKYQQNADQHWDDLALAREAIVTNGGGGKMNSPAAKGFLKAFDQPDRAPAPQFVYNAEHGGVYNRIMEWPEDESTLNQRLDFVTESNGRGEEAGYPGTDVPSMPIIAYKRQAIVCGPRLISGHKIKMFGSEKWFFRSHDEFTGRGGGDIADEYKRQAPTVFDYRRQGSMTLKASPGNSDTAVASEWWFEMPNGFLAWGIHGEGAQMRSAAEPSFAIDPYNPGLNLETGRCINCHIQGPMRAADPPPPGSTGWTSLADLNKVYDEIQVRYRGAMTKLVNALGSDTDTALNQQMVDGSVEPALYTLRVYEDERAKTDPFRKRDMAVSSNNDSRDGFGCYSFCNGFVLSLEAQSAANKFCADGLDRGRLDKNAKHVVGAGYYDSPQPAPTENGSTNPDGTQNGSGTGGAAPSGVAPGGAGPGDYGQGGGQIGPGGYDQGGSGQGVDGGTVPGPDGGPGDPGYVPQYNGGPGGG